MEKFDNTNSVSLSNKQSYIKALFIAVASGVIAFLVYWQVYQARLTLVQDYQDDKLSLVQTEFVKELSSIKKLTQVLADNKNLKRGNKLRYMFRDSKSLSDINDYFINFGMLSPIISQIRWIDITGNERFRIDFKDNEAKVVKKNELQNKMSRYYFRQGIAIEAPDSFLSKIDLNMEHGSIVEPYVPTIRVTYRTSSSDYIVDGLIVINFDLSSLFQRIRNYSADNAQVNIVNKDGFWLYNNDRSKEWGFMLEMQELTIANYNPLLWESMQNQQENTVRHFDSNVYTLDKLPTLFSQKYNETLNDVIYIYIKSKDKLITEIRLVALGYAGISAIFLLTIGGFILYREYCYTKVLSNLFEQLHAEKLELDSVNNKLSNTIRQQQLLQDSFVEAQKLSSLGMMVAGVAHEMNTPIGGAIISVSNAESVMNRLNEAIKTGLTKSQLESSVLSLDDNLALARVNLDKAAVLVKSFKKMAIDRNNEEFIKCNIEGLVKELLIALNSRLKTSKIKITTRFDGDYTIKSRPGVISQVIENLVINALNHAFEHNQTGEIEIKVYKNEKGDVNITVSDTGCGIEKNQQSSIFEPFHTSARGKGNIGLGLYMVSQWVTGILKGQLDLVSDPQREEKFKTQFTVTLPNK
ncbi:signal transduction histidine kinase regulating C4-dicarboxylate transport system [Pseudoalteromonas sp. BSi20652]|uniref:sensor histidine kinase n=1 Tax=Pseudoalteromonas sp. BSi20652 TaxID=388384 RepID=UPI0002316AF2|nr:HAMP domain-containing sensor histidine kinase [Pseudoalteromonas sp. BSi20652]GAA60943.1 signal transduction histidine kinase regulating C4-dicarboxylate transport system [Pseudoalteromonas sp. BSi20652]